MSDIFLNLLVVIKFFGDYQQLIDLIMEIIAAIIGIIGLPVLLEIAQRIREHK